MIKVIEKAVEKVAIEWVEKQFEEIFSQKERDTWGHLHAKNKLPSVVERIVDQEIRNITIKHLDKEKLDIKEIILDRLKNVKDKIEISVKSY